MSATPHSKVVTWMLVYSRPPAGVAIGDFIQRHLAMVESALANPSPLVRNSPQAMQQCRDIREALIALAELTHAVDEAMCEESEES